MKPNNFDDLTTLRELAKEMKVSKSKLYYYFKLGFISRTTTVGRMDVFSRSEVKKSLKVINDMREAHNLSLSEIHDKYFKANK